jgi:hypothetical protein
LFFFSPFRPWPFSPSLARWRVSCCSTDPACCSRSFLCRPTTHCAVIFHALLVRKTDKEGKEHGITERIVATSGCLRPGRRDNPRVLRLRTGGKGNSERITAEKHPEKIRIAAGIRSPHRWAAAGNATALNPSDESGRNHRRDRWPSVLKDRARRNRW